MARGLKENGLRELEALRNRVVRQLSLRRIWKTDADELIDLLNRAEAKIISMEEREEGL